jgi:hypothetical protein
MVGIFREFKVDEGFEEIEEKFSGNLMHFQCSRWISPLQPRYSNDSDVKTN